MEAQNKRNDSEIPTRTTSKNSIKRQSRQSNQCRCFKNFEEEIFLSELSNVLQSVSVTATDSNQNFTRWTQVFMSILDKHAPFKTKRVKESKQPEWINDYIKAAIRLRDRNHQLKIGININIGEIHQHLLFAQQRKDFFSKSLAENKDNAYFMAA